MTLLFVAVSIASIPITAEIIIFTTYPSRAFMLEKKSALSEQSIFQDHLITAYVDQRFGVLTGYTQPSNPASSPDV
jgi:hypothetical protein